MVGDRMYNIFNIILAMVFLLCWVLIIGKVILNRFSKVKTVKAKISDKYIPDTISNYPGAFKPKRYVVVFETNDEKLSFDVTEFSYGSYNIGDRGNLKYKGKRLISFR